MTPTPTFGAALGVLASRLINEIETEVGNSPAGRGHELVRDVVRLLSNHAANVAANRIAERQFTEDLAARRLS